MGLLSDGSAKDVTSTAAWSITERNRATSPSGAASVKVIVARISRRTSPKR